MLAEFSASQVTISVQIHDLPTAPRIIVQIAQSAVWIALVRFHRMDTLSAPYYRSNVGKLELAICRTVAFGCIAI
jgi:hypothetical protein